MTPRLLPPLFATLVALGAQLGGNGRAEPPPAWTRLPALPDAEGFASPFTGVAGGALLVAGGANFPGKRPWEGGARQWYAHIFALESPEGSWHDVGHLPRPLAYGVSVTSAHGVVCAGGGDARRHYRDVFLLQWAGQRPRIVELPPLPFPSAFASGVAWGEKVFLCGGIDEPEAVSAATHFVLLDLAAASPAWQSLPDLPGPGRMLAQMSAADGKIFLCGGVSLHSGADGKPARTYLHDTYSFDPATGWRRVADMPNAVAAAPSPLPASKDGKIYIFSGDDGTRVSLTGPNHPGFKPEVLIYHSRTDTWEKGADGPISRATAPTAFWRGGWVIASGEYRPGYRTPEMWMLQLGS